MDNDEKVQLYYKLRQEKNGEVVVEGYAYGEEWVAMAMYMDDMLFDTPEAAKEWWEKNYE